MQHKQEEAFCLAATVWLDEKAEPMKIIWLDTETTGTDPIQNDIWQLAYILIDNGQEVYRHIVECKPWCPWNVDPAALAVGRTVKGKPISEMGFETLMKPWHAIDRFKADLQRQKFIDPYNKDDKAAIGGYVATFDAQMLHWWFKKSGDKYGLGSYTNHTILDAAPLIRIMRHVGFLDLSDSKLGTVAAHYDVTMSVAHNAMSDAEAAMQVFPAALADFREMLNQEQYLGQLTEGKLI
jgi:DNA polymerase III epsilon subunit-like protein